MTTGHEFSHPCNALNYRPVPRRGLKRRKGHTPISPAEFHQEFATTRNRIRASYLALAHLSLRSHPAAW